MTPAQPKNIAIVGGSLGGLFAGVALKHLRKDLNIRILERNPTPLLHDQGAGVVAGQDVQDFFRKHDRTKTPLTITSYQRLYLDKSGNVIRREKTEQHMTSWDLLYHLMRANFDGVGSEYAKAPASEDHEGTTAYDYGHQVTNVNLRNAEPLTITAKTSKGDEVTIDTDMIIGADGPSSEIRKLIDPSVKRKYAGYVAWRGTVPEDQVSQAATDVFVEKFPFFHTEGIQILAYTIPGPNGTVEAGKRLLNWVWYVNYPEESAEHVQLMTDKNGKRHHITLPPGGIQDSVWQRQKEFAKEVLPPQFAELVEKTEVPFIQAITDVISPAAVLPSDHRVLLIGDALAGFRPHTAASTNQAALDAMELAEAIDKILQGADRDETLKAWEDSVLDYAKTMQQHGILNAYEILTDPISRSAYDKHYPAILRAWSTYWRDSSHWQRQENQRTADENTRRAKDAQAQERRRKKAEYNRNWREKKLQEEQVAKEKQKERARQAAAMAAFAEALSNAQKDAYERQFQQEEQYAHYVFLWQQHADIMAAKHRQHIAKQAEVEARERRVAEKALEERRKVAEKRLQEQERQQALAAKLLEAAAARAERERYEQQEFQKEREAQLEWILAHVGQEEREKKKELNKAHVKPTMSDMQCNSHEMADDTGQNEAEAAQKFIRDIMRIRGESKADVLKDIVLITLEAVDQEIVSQKPGCKRKISTAQDDPGRLPALVADLFTRMESYGDGKEKFRFSKKRKLT
ncbi:hypothetical protein E8E13_005397 [Curvularia kusanoi]|uniref:2,6-dihydroxypyridine 3-monooxygenase substrate binding domain-containing protein n=1 Tax=Curvularia kusanoi TaxID=90978 RepID=A0A9P4T9C8_CURKU|nr:hypothetical protein E8E13_005397 [Curvularia kusanoi]